MRFMNAHRVGQLQVGLLAAFQLDAGAVKIDQQGAGFVLAEDDAEITVID